LQLFWRLRGCFNLEPAIADSNQCRPEPIDSDVGYSTIIHQYFDLLGKVHVMKMTEARLRKLAFKKCCG
jgi:hypothetical protein